MKRGSMIFHKRASMLLFGTDNSHKWPKANDVTYWLTCTREVDFKRCIFAKFAASWCQQLQYHIVSNIGAPQNNSSIRRCFLIGTERWSKGTLIGAAPSTCIRMEKDNCEVADWSCQWQVPKMSGRATMSTNTYGIHHKNSSPLLDVLSGMSNFLQWDKLYGTEQCTALCTGIK